MSDPSFVKQWLVDLCGQIDEEILNQFSELTEDIKIYVGNNPDMWSAESAYR